ncbi:MAG: DUF1552 domain-containing protein [Isosphaeraceae bacterium]|nr:DUF1552 domain-containing protein [Isosphaeraceae bacterium]
MAPVTALGRSSEKAPAPLRMAFLYIPNGVHMPAWTPEAIGADFKLPPILEPLAPLKEDLLVLSGLAQKNAFSLGDGPGDHARSLACFLTGVHPKKTNGADIKVGISVDQVAAQKIGHATRFPSLELGCERGAQAGNCDSGYSCAYSSNISWRSESTPMAKEINPRLVFERLFASDRAKEVGDARARRERYKKSILDFVIEDAEQLSNRLGTADRRKVDEYLTSIREIELRLVRAETTSADLDLPSDFTPPVGIPQDYAEHVRLMLDLLALAFQGDVTRIATFVYANEGSTRSYRFLGVPEGHHDLSHHGGDPRKHEKLKIINRFHIEQFARFLQKLKAIPEGDGTVLDHSMIVYGSGIADGNRHNHDDLPILLVGKGGGTIKTGRHLRYEKRTPLNNLYLSMLDRMGTPVESLGDSTGRLDQLEG